MIVFPAIDLRRGRCVRLRQGQPEDETVYSDDPASVARRWIAEGAQWLHIVNLDGALGDTPSGSGLAVNLQRLEEICRVVPAVPIQVGGGVRTLADLDLVFSLGANRAILGTVAVRNPELVAEAVRRFGAERVVVGIDARDGRAATHGWQQTSDQSAVALGRAMREAGVSRVVYTDIARDGMLTGVNVKATAELARSTGLRVIASGGVASLEDVQKLRVAATDSIEGVIIGQALYTGAVSLPDAIRVAADCRSSEPPCQLGLQIGPG
jgi:phosphoribosylformimino-5-aminoimidazole carboxamide ribotide isomerase